MAGKTVDHWVEQKVERSADWKVETSAATKVVQMVDWMAQHLVAKMAGGKAANLAAWLVVM